MVKEKTIVIIAFNYWDFEWLMCDLFAFFICSEILMGQAIYNGLEQEGVGMSEAWRIRFCFSFWLSGQNLWLYIVSLLRSKNLFHFLRSKSCSTMRKKSPFRRPLIHSQLLKRLTLVKDIVKWFHFLICKLVACCKHFSYLSNENIESQNNGGWTKKNHSELPFRYTKT